MKQLKIGIIGVGNLGEAILKGLSKHNPKNILVSRRSSEALEKLKEKYNVNTTTNNNEVIVASDVIVLAVEPHQLDNVIQETKSNFSDKLIISVIAGKSLSYFKEKLGKVRVIRTMPNLCLLVGKGATAYTLNESCTKKDEEMVKYVLNGLVEPVSEELINEVSIISGCGPAFMSFILESMQKATKDKGLDQETARKFAAQMLAGTAKLLEEKTYDEIVSGVATKGGITAAGIEYAKDNHLDKELKEMVKAALKKADEFAK